MLLPALTRSISPFIYLYTLSGWHTDVAWSLHPTAANGCGAAAVALQVNGGDTTASRSNCGMRTTCREGKELPQGGGGSHNESFHMVFVKTTATLFTRRARGRESDRYRLVEQLRAPSGVNNPTVDEKPNF